MHFPWFALTVRPNHEHTALRSLRNQGFEAYLPAQRVRHRWSDRSKEIDSVLFPGYVFCRFGFAERLQVLRASGVRSIVGTPSGPVSVEEEEIAAVRALVSCGRPITRWPYLRTGANVVVAHGPLAYLRGVVVRIKDSLRVVVSVNALGVSAAVEIEADMLAPDPVLHGDHQA